MASDRGVGAEIKGQTKNQCGAVHTLGADLSRWDICIDSDSPGVTPHVAGAYAHRSGMVGRTPPLYLLHTLNPGLDRLLRAGTSPRFVC